MKEYRYILEPYKGLNTRFNCPLCKHKKSFVLYIDMETGKHIHPSVGRCNREINCGYHYPPKMYFQDNDLTPDKHILKQNNTPKMESVVIKDISFIPHDIFRASLKSNGSNNFEKYLIGLFGIEITHQLKDKYHLGTSKHWNGATVFWQIEVSGKIRTGKIMLYNPNTGRRIKEPFNHITWAHTVLNLPDYTLRQCLFGEHLIAYNSKPVALVESEKTAIIASVYLPQFIWLATSGAEGLSKDKCEILNKYGQFVVLFPDISQPIEGNETTYMKWTRLANKYLHRYTVSDLLERKATIAEKKQGLDLADYLIKFDYKKFNS
jgi:hypothetical protein